MLLAAFLLTETRAAQPITPLRLFADVSRSGSFAARLLVVAGMFGMLFFLTQFLQDVLGFSPLAAGVGFLPMTVTLFAVSRFAPRLIPVVGARRLMIVGMLPVIAGMAWVRPEDSGAASSMVNVMQQVGGSLGLAALVAVFGTAYRNGLAHPVAGLSATALRHRVLAHGMSEAFALAAVFDVVTLLLIVVALRTRPRRPAAQDPARSAAETVSATAGE